MDLKEKLAKLDRSTPVSDFPPSDIVRPAIAFSLPGEEFLSESGLYWRNQSRYDLASDHGRYRIGKILENDSASLMYVAKNKDCGNIRLENLLFMDTETTGLSGGVGTAAFLIGIGYFEDDQFVIDQFFMREFNEERPVLQSFLSHFYRAISADGAVVSFNGKSFDLPLLANRAIFLRLDWPENSFPNIDVLHPARRLWREPFEDCSLSALECQVLRVERAGDVPGYLIPEIYFRYMRTRDPRPLEPVFYHNQMDILSLVGLLHEMMKLYEGAVEPFSQDVDWLRMGQAFDDMHAFDEGLKFYQDLLAQDLSPDKRMEVLLRIGAIHKKNLNYADAVSFWQEALQQGGFCLEAYEELAKVYEHRIVDLALAKHFTQRALENLEIMEGLRQSLYYAQARKGLMWRLKRLERKLGRLSGR